MATRSPKVSDAFGGPRYSSLIEVVEVPSRLGGVSYELELHRCPDGSLVGLLAADFPPGSRQAHSPKTGEIIRLGDVRERRERKFTSRVSAASMAMLKRFYDMVGRRYVEPNYGALLSKPEQRAAAELLRRNFLGVWFAKGIRIYHITKLGQQYYRLMKDFNHGESK